MINKNFIDLYKMLKLNSDEELETKRARLFPGGKIKVEDERATASMFFAVLIGIKEFRERLLSSLMSNGSERITNQTAQLHAYTEIFDNTLGYPDGLLVLTTGKKDKVISWAAYIEVKTKAVLEKAQIEKYLIKTKKDNVPALITVSNDYVSCSNISPTGMVNKNLFHWSWKEILSELNYLKHNRLIEDEDQSYIANEFIRYLNNHNDIKDFSDMGDNWESSAKYVVSEERITKSSDELLYVVKAWSCEEKDIAIKLSDTKLAGTGYHKVDLDLSKIERAKENEHVDKLKEHLYKNRELRSQYIIKDLSSKIFASDKLKRIEVNLKLRGRSLSVLLRVQANDKLKAKGQTALLINQLRDAGMEDEIQIISNFGRKQSSSATLKELRRQKEYNEDYSIIPVELKRDKIKEHLIFAETDLGGCFYSRRKIIVNIETVILQFYREVAARFIE